MKRRGTNRRQVLDLETNSSSPKRSWQTKYQQIYMDHLNHSAAPTAVTPVPPAAAQNGSESESRLPQLVGYTSDSEGDEPKNPAGDIDSKVQDFLKEISDIVPSVASNPDISSIDDESSRDSVKKSKSKSKKVVGPSLPGSTDTSQPTLVQSSNQQPTIAWQECYDENSGCYYFWNMETNEVTWEMPEALRAYQVALEQWNAQQLLLAQQVGVITGFTTQSSNQQLQKKQGSNKPMEKSKNKRSKPAASDSEEEKIELITSYGPNSDEDDSDSSSHHSSKKKKVESSKSSKKDKKKEKEISIGPQLPPGYTAPVEVKETKPAESETTPLNPEKADLKQKESKKKNNENKDTVVKVHSKPLTHIVETYAKDTPLNTMQQDVNKVNALQRLKNLKSKASDDSSSEDSASSDSSNSSDSEVCKIKKNNEENEEEEEDEEDDDVEDSILERLKNQAKILKELGGEIPEEIKELIETNSDSEKDKVPTPPNEKEEAPVGKELEKEMQKEIKSEGIWPENEETDTIEDVLEEIIDANSESSKDANIIDKPFEVVEAELKEVNNLQSAPPAFTVVNEVHKKPPEKGPTSFSLIAGYGNEDDSEPEEEKPEEEKSKVNGKPAPLFPIISVLEEEKKVDQPEIKLEKNSIKIANMKVIKLSAKAKELIHSSTTTGKARATEFVNTADGLKPASSMVKDNEVLGDESRGFPEPIKKVSRKKRLEVPVFRKPEKEPLLKVETFSNEASSDKKQEETPLNDTRQSISEEKVEIAPKTSSTAYTSTWAFNSELKGGEYRGFGYGHDYESDQKPKASKKGMIQFVKSDTLMPKTEHVVNLPEKKLPVEGLRQEDECSNAQKEQTKELAQVITEKVKFLCEGKEVVPPVQVMAIQLETLATAHNAGGLSVQYLWQWLTSLDGQLASLEQAAAPQGWLCQWDRSYKRYFYRNEVSGSIQWEYPEVGATAMDVTEVGAPEPPPPPPAPTQGGEEAMELCDSPPPPQPPATPPPPRISMSRTPSPTIPDEPAPPLPPLPPPPPVISEQPPLPPLPPSESPPPPPLPPSPPPPPPPPMISIAPGEPLPPGVDMTDELFEGPRPPLPVAPPPPPTTPPPPPPPPDISGESVDQPVYGMGYDATMHYDTYQMRPVPEDYSSGVYPYTGAASGGGDYVIARPPASNPVPPPATSSLATELDSFYNEVAALDPPLPPPEPSPSPPPPPESPPPPQPQPQPAVADVTGKKKKKTKLAPGLALKKKGVSSLVAKWQQVQQDVRREAANEETPN